MCPAQQGEGSGRGEGEGLTPATRSPRVLHLHQVPQEGHQCCHPCRQITRQTQTAHCYRLTPQQMALVVPWQTLLMSK